MSEQPAMKLDYFEKQLRRQSGGAELADAFQAHVEEIVELINKNRRVAAVWQRNKGPAFIQAAIQGRAGNDVVIPKEVNGVPLEILLLRLADALQRHGSLELRRTVAERSLQVMRWARVSTGFCIVREGLESRHQTEVQPHG